MSQTRADLIRDGAAELTAADVPDAARDARLLMRWADGLSEMAMRPLPSGFSGAGTWADESGWERSDLLRWRGIAEAALGG